MFFKRYILLPYRRSKDLSRVRKLQQELDIFQWVYSTMLPSHRQPNFKAERDRLRNEIEEILYKLTTTPRD